MEHKQLIDYLPGFLRDYREYRTILAAEQAEVDAMYFRIDQLYENQFIETCDEAGIEHYEKMFGITKLPDATLQERIFNVMARLAEQLPYTENALRGMLTSLCGPDGFKLTVNPYVFSVEVNVELTAKNNLLSVRELLSKVLPCNIMWDANLIYNQHFKLGHYTHEQLTAYTHDYLRNEVIP